MGAAAADHFVQLPAERRIRVNEPVLSVTGVEVSNLPERALDDEALGMRDGGNPAVVVANHVHDLGIPDRGEHGLGLLHVQREGLFTKHVLAGLGGGDRDLSVRVVVGADVHDVNEGRLDQFLPIGGGELPAEPGAGGLDAGGVASADSVQLGPGF